MKVDVIYLVVTIIFLLNITYATNDRTVHYSIFCTEPKFANINPYEKQL
jgi:hypothetical protein